MASHPLYLFRREVQQCFKGGRLHITDRQQKQKEMVVLFTWFNAKPRYSSKYVNAWNNRGNDVLHVRCNTLDVLFPRKRADMIALHALDFINKRDQPTVLHGLCAGSYLIGRIMMASQNTNVKIPQPIWQIHDSVITYPAMEEGMKIAAEIDGGPQYRNLVSFVLFLFKKLWDRNSFLESESFLCKSPPSMPVLYLHSLGDEISPYDGIRHLVAAQQQVGPLEEFLIDEKEDVAHVNLISYLGEERYMEIISNFLAKYPNEESWKHNYPMDPDAVPAYKLMKTPAYLAKWLN